MAMVKAMNRMTLLGMPEPVHKFVVRHEAVPVIVSASM